MRYVHLLALTVLAASLPAQVTVLPVPGSQANRPGAALMVNGTHDLTPPVPFTALGPGTGSETVGTSHLWAWVPSTGPSDTVTATVTGAAGLPLAFLVEVQPSPTVCPGPGGPVPCQGQPWLPAGLPTAFGTLHLGFPPVVVVDGIGLGLGGPPGALGPSGSLSFSATVPWSLPGSPLQPVNAAAQALVADPTAAGGYAFTAAFGLARWIVSCPACR